MMEANREIAWCRGYWQVNILLLREQTRKKLMLMGCGSVFFHWLSLISTTLKQQFMGTVSAGVTR
jgi:hypothetical protein